MKRLMITKNLVVKIQNLIVNHESQPVKLNPVMCAFKIYNIKIKHLLVCNIILSEIKNSQTEKIAVYKNVEA